MTSKKNIQAFKYAVALVVMAVMPFCASAQLVVTQGTTLGMTPEQLVQNVLVGQGVTVENVKFNGSLGTISCNAIGTFNTGNTPTNLGLDSGIVMGSGGVSFAVGPNNSGGGSQSSGCTSYSCAPLMNLSSVSLLDCAVLEFDFFPSSDSIKFNYIFASEEYPEYVCTSKNDRFGFFISGLDPNGSMYSNYNIALIPGTTTGVSINAVNNGTVGSAGGSTSTAGCVLSNSAYYVTNNQNYIQYDGFTTVLTAQAAVVPCTRYHLVLAIADGDDGAWDSGVFLEANSLSSNGIEFSFDNPSNPENASDLYEGCMAVVNLTRPQQRTVPTPITVDYWGTAINGEDFDQKNSSYSFPANQDTAVFTLLPYMDSLVEGVEQACFAFRTYETCPADTFCVNILDVEPMGCRIERDTLTSETYSVWLRAVVEGGMPNHLIKWTNSVNDQVRYGDSIYVPTSTDTYWYLSVHDSCGTSRSDTMLVGIRHHFAFQCRDTIICAGEPLDLNMRFRMDSEGDSCVWYQGNSTTPIELGNDTLRLYPQESSKYYIRSYITWNGQIWEDYDSINVVVVPLPEIHVSASEERVCLGESTTLSGTGAYKYSWVGDSNFVDASTHTYVPDTTGYILVHGLAAGAECYGNDSVLIVVDTMPAIEISDGGGVCGGEDAELTVTTIADGFSWSALPADPTLVGQETRSQIIVNPSVTTVYTVTANSGVCVNTASTTVAVESMPVAIGEVTPRTVSLGSMEAVFSDKSEHSTTRRWEFPDGVVSEEREVSYLVPDDVDSISVLLWAYNPYLCFDTTTVTVYVDHTTLWVPNAFTPDESTNKTFLVKLNDVQRYHIFIYDRRGQLVFESFDPEQPWDGTSQKGEKCPQGVYTYLISCHKITYPYDQIVKKGTVVLLR